MNIRIFDSSDEDGSTRDKERNIEDGDCDTPGIYDIQTEVDAESDTDNDTESDTETEVDNRLPWDRNLASFPLILRGFQHFKGKFTINLWHCTWWTNNPDNFGRLVSEQCQNLLSAHRITYFQSQAVGSSIRILATPK